MADSRKYTEKGSEESIFPPSISPQLSSLFESENELAMLIAMFLPLNHGQTSFDLALVCRAWRSIVDSEIYWQAMLDKYFPGDEKRLKKLKELYNEDPEQGKSNKEKFISYLQNRHKKFIPQQHCWPDADQRQLQALLVKLFLRAREGDVKGFLNLFENELSLFQMENYSTNYEKLLTTLTDVTDFTRSNILGLAIAFGHQTFLDGIYHYLCQQNIDKLCQDEIDSWSDIDGIEAPSIFNTQYNKLILAVTFNQLEAVKEILRKNPREINTSTFEGYSPLNVAARYGHTQILEYLLANGADINLISKKAFHEDENQRNPLFEAVYFGHLSCVRVLVDHGADINACLHHEISESTPLSLALMRVKNDEIAQFLLDRGANPNASQDTISTIMQHAVFYHSTTLAVQIFDRLVSVPHAEPFCHLRNCDESLKFIAHLLKRDLMYRGVQVSVDPSIRELLTMGADPSSVRPELLGLDETIQVLFDVANQFKDAMSSTTTKDMTSKLKSCFAKDQELTLSLIHKKLRDEKEGTHPNQLIVKALATSLCQQQFYPIRDHSLFSHSKPTRVRDDSDIKLNSERIRPMG